MAQWYSAAPPVVQGQPYYGESPYGGQQQHQQHYYEQKPTTASAYQQQTEFGGAAVDNSSTKPIRQRGCRDAIWAILFYAHLGGIAFITVVYTPQVVNGAIENYSNNNNSGGEQRLLQEEQDNNNGDGGDNSSSNSGGGYDAMDIDIDPAALGSMIAIMGALACLLSSLALGFMMRFAEGLIKMALIFNVVSFTMVAIGSLVSGLIPGAIMGLVMAGIAAYYAFSVWGRVPFAASNLVTAVTAVQANLGLTLYAYISLILLFGWSLWWSAASLSAVLVLGDCDANGNCSRQVSGIIIFLLLLSYYWTMQVITNVVHVTVSGTVGTWWFAPREANGCCSSAVRESYVRAMTTSFGSICLGSLIVALIQALKEMIHQLRENGDSFLACCAECLIGLLESMVEYFNRWAYVYVALYGMSFMEAGSSVMTLFRNRGWTTIITDLMIDTVLTMVGLGVGAMTALVGALLGVAFHVGSAATIGAAAFVGFILGYGMSATLFSVVSSAVNTVIVCYAEAPREFDANHPQLSAQMRTAWRQAWPNDFNY